MDTTESMPAMLKLQPGSAAAACIISHLSKHDRQQFSLSCKHARILAVAAVTQLNLGHKWYSATRSIKASNSSSGSASSSASGSSTASSSSGSPGSSGYNSRTFFPHCTCVAVRPRTMDELSNMTSALLLHKVKQLPALTDLRLDLQGVYDKHCDLSLILKSIPLHAPQLASLSLQQAAMLTAKSVAAMSDMPQLSSLTLRNVHGFEPGALAKLSGIPNLTHLHLEILEPGSTTAAGGNTVQVSAPGPGSSTVTLTPSELARLQASDEVGLAKCTRLVSLAAINLGQAGALRPVQALLGAIAGSLKPRLASLVLGNMPDLPPSAVEVAAGIPSLCFVSLAGCDVAGSADVAKLAVLTGLARLELAPQLPPAATLAAVVKGCKRLTSMSMGAAQLGAAAAVMSGVSELQLLAATPLGTRLAAGGPDSGSPESSSMAAMSLRVRPPLQLTGFGRAWPNLKRLEMSGWALDAAGVAAIRQLESLISLKLVGGCQMGEAQQAKLLLPLLDMPELQQLVLLETRDLTDEWVADAMRGIGAAGGGSFCAVRELTLGAVTGTAASGSDNTASAGTAAKAATGAAAAPLTTQAAASGVADGSQMMTDRGLVRLFACPQLRKLTLVEMPGITLAAVKALVRGSSTLAVVEAVKCPAISAAPAEAAARAAVVAPDRAIDFWVSP